MAWYMFLSYKITRLLSVFFLIELTHSTLSDKNYYYVFLSVITPPICRLYKKCTEKKNSKFPVKYPSASF